jgi:hypothetical protein
VAQEVIAMHRHIHFWYTTLARGLVALVAGSAILFVPEAAGSLLLPMATAFSVLTLAAYGVVDSSLVLLSSTMSRSRLATVALRAQGVLGMVVGVLLFAVVYERVRLEWFFLLAGVQALCMGVTEVVVALHTSSHAKTVWNYAAAGVAFSFGFTYLLLRFGFAGVLSSEEMCWLIYGYLLAFGLFETVTVLRMLYGGHHAGRLTDRPHEGSRAVVPGGPTVHREEKFAR